MAIAAKMAQVVHSGRRVNTNAIITETAIKYIWFTFTGECQKMATSPTMEKFQTRTAAVTQSMAQLRFLRTS
jgi:hypothetical protein